MWKQADSGALQDKSWKKMESIYTYIGRQIDKYIAIPWTFLRSFFVFFPFSFQFFHIFPLHTPTFLSRHCQRFLSLCKFWQNGHLDESNWYHNMADCNSSEVLFLCPLNPLCCMNAGNLLWEYQVYSDCRYKPILLLCMEVKKGCVNICFSVIARQIETGYRPQAG